MSLDNSVDFKLDLSRAEGNILVDRKITEAVVIDPDSIVSLPARDRYLQLKESIARYYDFQSEGVVIGNGSDELIDSIARERGGGVSLTLVPTFERLFEVGAKFNYDSSSYPLRLSEGYQYTDTFHEDFIAKIRELSPDIVWLCSPDNPTGAVISVEQLADIAGAAKDSWIVIDVAFADIVDEFLVSRYGALTASHENIIVLNSFSKSWGLAGLRLGFVLASKKIADLIARHSVMFNVNVVALDTAFLCLESDGYKTVAFSNIKKNIAEIQRGVDDMNKYQIVMNTPLNLFCIRHRTKLNLHEELLKLGIKTKSLDKMPGMENEGFCRILVPKSGADVEKLLQALALIS